jgi:arylsulfatase A-like enzyme
LKDAGYETALIGKWHLGNWYQRQLPLQRGFDYHYGIYGALVSYYGKTRDRYYDWHRNGETIREEGYTTDLLARDFEQHLAAKKSDRPFFYYLPFTAIHGPDTVPVEKNDELQKRLAKDSTDAANRHHLLLTTKALMLESLDTAVGRVLDAVEAQGYRENTLIVFFNDNGGRLINAPFRGGKGDTYEGGVRVPCLFYWPGHVPAGKTVDGIVHVVDLYPTLINLAGGSINQPLAIDGMDIWDAIVTTKPIARTEVVHSLPGEHVETGTQSIRQGPWKLVGNELYNLDVDSGETNDVSVAHLDIVRQLKDRLQHLVAERRQAEPHLKIPHSPLLVFGEQENAHPPEWLTQYLESISEPKKEKRQRK